MVAARSRDVGCSMRARTQFFALALLLGACAQPPDLTDESIELITQVNDVRAGICMCAEDAGYDSMVACGDAVGLVGESERLCVTTVLEDLGDDGADYLACVTAAYTDGASCLLANTDCATGQVSTCEQAREAAVAACSQIPTSDALAFEACL